MAEEKRKYTPVENRLLYEWCIKNYPKALQWRRVRVGPIPKSPEEKLYGVLRRWVDAVIFTGKKVILVEAKIRPHPDAIGQLLLYNELFPKTPEFSQLKDYPRELVFLTTKEDNAVRNLCRQHNIKFVVYRPKWIEEYWKELMKKMAKR